MNTTTRQTGSAHVIIIIILVVALLAALGFIFWQRLNMQTPKTTTDTETSQSTKKEETTKIDTDEPEATGELRGSLTYPSDVIPAGIEVHAVNIDTNKEYITKEHITSSDFQYGVGYSMNVPVGRYYVYGTLAEMGDTKAYYNQVIVCGIKVDCKDTTKIEVKVEAGQRSIDAIVGDWWTN